MQHPTASTGPLGATATPSPAPAPAPPLKEAASQKEPEALGPFQYARLPYASDALAPYISADTLKTHWGKHYRGTDTACIRHRMPVDSSDADSCVVALPTRCLPCHVTGYVDALNTIVKTEHHVDWGSKKLTTLVRELPPGKAFNMAAQAWNHGQWTCGRAPVHAS
jgi:hypothetical protein